jgi:hypothetical protein
MRKTVAFLMFFMFVNSVTTNVQAQLESESWQADPYFGVFALAALPDSGFMGGADFRLNIPVYHFTRNLSFAISYESGFLYGHGANAPWGNEASSDIPLGIHNTATIGLRSRFRHLSIGLRTGYSLWISPFLSLNDSRFVRHAAFFGGELGLGSPRFSVIMSFDVHVGENGMNIPIIGLGFVF